MILNFNVLDSDVHELFINTLTNFQLLPDDITHLNGTHIDQICIQKVFFPETVTVSASVKKPIFQTMTQ